MLYMDCAATTPMSADVIDAMTGVMRDYYGNPSSLHRLGLEAERLVRRSRETIAGALHCRADEIFFTSGGTESNNWALAGAAAQYAGRGRHLITTAIEHASVYEPARRLERDGWRVTWLQPDETGRISPDDVSRALTDDTTLVSVMHVNNETGAVQPIEEIARLLRPLRRVLFHVDAVQSIGKLPLDMRALGVDLLSGAAHKLHGPKGAGFVYCRSGVTLAPLLYGGGQEGGLRSGTENVPALVGMAKAVRLAAERQQAFARHGAALRRELTEAIAGMPELRLTDTGGDAAPHIVHFCYPGMKSEVVVHALEQRGLYVSAQSACSSGASRPSRVLQAMGMSDTLAASGIRISYSLEHTAEDIRRAAEALRETVAALRSSAATGGGRMK